MRRALACVLACLVAFQPAAVWARQGAPPAASAIQSQPSSSQATPAQTAPIIEVRGVSFERIKRELRILPPSTAKTPLKLEYYVEVQGLLPPIPIFKPGELTTGPVPYGAPTHADILDLFTPVAFKSPAVPVSTLAIMGFAKLVQWQVARAREERREAERKAAIDAERERQRRLKESVVVSPPK